MTDAQKSHQSLLDSLAKALADAVPAGLVDVKNDLQKNFTSILQSGLAQCDVVTREEFDTQVAVLKRTREKLVVLEKQVAELEAIVDPNKHPPSDKS